MYSESVVRPAELGIRQPGSRTIRLEFGPVWPLFQLAFQQPMHEFNTGQRTLCGVERLEPQHGPGDPLDAAMILSHDIIKVLDLADDDRGAMLLVVSSDSSGMSLADIEGLTSSDREFALTGRVLALARRVPVVPSLLQGL